MVHVAVAVIKNAAGEVLLSKRADHVHQGGLWEFPGGKVELGETVTAALQRELVEELGVQAETFRPLIVLSHPYSDKTVTLDVWEITGFTGAPTGREGQPLSWVAPHLLAKRKTDSSPYPLPEANFGIVKAITLPAAMAISGDFKDEADFLRRLGLAVQRGAKIIQCRLPAMALGESKNLIEKAAKFCHKSGVLIVVNTHFNGTVSELIDGHHLNAKQLLSLKNRNQFAGGLLGASCHNLTELQHASNLDLDYVTLSPVQTTASHPDAPVLGWEQFEQFVGPIKLPVYALGGLGIDAIDKAQKKGGQGIAAIGAFWNE